jgi:hypothetical protein
MGEGNLQRAYKQNNKVNKRGGFMFNLFKKHIVSFVSAVMISIVGLTSVVPATVASASTHHTVAKQTTLRIVSSDLYVHHNDTAYVTIKTTPGAYCTIKVVYKSGQSHAKGLNPKRAGKSGIVTWSWKIGPSTTLGNWPIYITANGKTIKTYVHVRRA